jgi:hypothetical protein
MTTGDKISLIGLIVALVACVGTWLVVPGFQRWANKRKRWMAIVAVLLSAFRTPIRRSRVGKGAPLVVTLRISSDAICDAKGPGLN